MSAVDEDLTNATGFPAYQESVPCVCLEDLMQRPVYRNSGNVLFIWNSGYCAYR